MLHEVVRAICEEEPTLPSTVVGQVEDAPGETATAHPLTPETVSEAREGAPARLRRRLEGDLDQILLKALDKEPVRRYRSVEQFGEDVRGILRVCRSRPENLPTGTVLESSFGAIASASSVRSSR